MSDETKIKPAMSAEEWAEFNRGLRAARATGGRVSPNFDADLQPLPQIVAQANALLADDDPLKITREWVRVIRQRADALLGDIPKRFMDAEQAAKAREEAAKLSSIALTLESYLPPEP